MRRVLEQPPSRAPKAGADVGWAPSGFRPNYDRLQNCGGNMFEQAAELYRTALDEISQSGLYKHERVLTTPQGARVRTVERARQGDVLNFCANNYLGLASHPRLIEAAKHALDTYGFGLASVRFICGTQTVHKDLEQEIARFFRTDDAILYSSCFDANGGLFETLLTDEDAIISDALNHASIIDGIRLSKAERHRYPNGDMDALESALKATAGKRLRLVATDGVFSMDGGLARLDTICELAARYNAMVMVDDSHATGFIGPNRSRNTRAFRRHGKGRSHHQHPRKSSRRRVGRIYYRSPRGHCTSAPAF